MSDILRVLVVDEDPDSRVSTKKALQRAQLGLAGEVGYGTEAVSLALDVTPDIMLVAVEEPVGRALETAESLANALPETPTIIYSSIDTAEAVRRSMIFGARDYIVKPVQAGRILEAVNTVLVQEEVRQMRRSGQLLTSHGRGTIVTVTGAKGGIGKTVVSVNLAIALGQQTGKRVAILDADTHFGDVATMLDLTPAFTLGDVFVRTDGLNRDSIRDFVTGHASGVEILAAPSDEEAWSRCDGESLTRLIDLVAQTYDFVVIDTAGSFDKLVRACIEAASLTLVLTTGEVSSVRDTAAALRRVESWDIERERVKVLLNRGVRVDGVGISELKGAINREIFWELPYDKRLPVSVQLGQPIVAHNGSSPAARNISALARLIAGTKRSLVRPQERRPLWRRLLRVRGNDNDSAVATIQKPQSAERQAG